MAEPVPLTVLAGYLGAGKTTLLNAILAADHGLRITVLVNDFGEVALDESLIRNRAGETLALANGCVCCSIGGDMWDAINRVLKADPLPDRLIIEASGVADPGRIARIALADPDLADAGIVTVADAVNLEAALDDQALKEMVEGQLRGASLIVLSKTDAVAPDAVTVAMARIATIAPGRPIALSKRGEKPVEAILNAAPARPAAPVGTPALAWPRFHGDVYDSWSWSGEAAVDPGRLAEFLDDDELGVWRIKGIVRDAGGTCHVVHRVGGQRELRPAAEGEEQAAGSIVAIGLANRFDPFEIARRWQAVLIPSTGR